MPEAVIAAAARTPIGRARKGSLADVRPEDMAAFAVRAALDKVPELDGADVREDELAVGVATAEGRALAARRLSGRVGLAGRRIGDRSLLAPRLCGAVGACERPWTRTAIRPPAIASASTARSRSRRCGRQPRVCGAGSMSVAICHLMRV